MEYENAACAALSLHHQVALAAWRALFFRSGVPKLEQPARSAEWKRGRLSALGLGIAPDAIRRATLVHRADAAFRGGLIPVQNWCAGAHLAA